MEFLYPLLYPIALWSLMVLPPQEPEVQPTGKQVAASLGYRAEPRGFQDADMADPFIQLRAEDQ